ncbi:MAG: BREX-2 system adenine-specific DNA-methyltransferase PglX [Myxococcales bacterium]|nr:BREX-2 system adenine-specific DNA-methyltransferase PglX [Myxococcales bacterium]
MDSQRLFFQLAPSLTERDYLLMVWKELAQYPAARGLFDAEHSLVWRLSPSAELAKELLALFRTPTAEAPAFRFGQASTRFLGDLYQDLSEDVRKRYALLQTPDFVESFILDRTLEPAVVRFGLDDTTVIDPTCGSGHFLLGAFGRLFEHRRRLEPGVDARVAAVKAVDAVYGADINPYAVAIARFRLTLEVLGEGGVREAGGRAGLAAARRGGGFAARQSPARPAELRQQDTRAALAPPGSATRSPSRTTRPPATRCSGGSPPWWAIRRTSPRRTQPSARSTARCGRLGRRQDALSAPFCERFFQLARPRGYVGQITANSFMKREFGKKLIEEYLPTVNLDLIVNTSGAYIPGHGTPTVLLFGTQEAATSRDVLAVLAKRGEPSTPENPAEGKVWRSVVEHWEEVGYEDEYLSVARVARDGLAKHPWSLGGGGASELKELLEERAERRLGDVATAIGSTRSWVKTICSSVLSTGCAGWVSTALRCGSSSKARGCGTGASLARRQHSSRTTSASKPCRQVRLLRSHFWQFRIPHRAGGIRQEHCRSRSGVVRVPQLLQVQAQHPAEHHVCRGGYSQSLCARPWRACVQANGPAHQALGGRFRGRPPRAAGVPEQLDGVLLDEASRLPKDVWNECW